MKILVVGPSWVGDSVMAQALYKRIKQEEPSAKIEVIAPEWSLSLLDRMPEVDKKIASPFTHGDIKVYERFQLGKNFNEKVTRGLLSSLTHLSLRFCLILQKLRLELDG